MDLANAIFTFVPAAAIASSVALRVVKHYQKSLAHRAGAVTPQRARPDLPTHVMFRSRQVARTCAAQGAVARTTTTALPSIAKPGNAGNAELPGNPVARPIPVDARDIIRMQAKAEACAVLLTSKKLSNKAETIELIFDCKRSGRPTSIYQQAIALVDSLLTRFPQRTEEQDANRKELELSSAA